MGRPRGRKHKLNEMIDEDAIYELGKTRNVLRLWRNWHESTQAKLGAELGVPAITVCAMERWGLGKFDPEYQEQLAIALAQFKKWGIEPEHLGLQYEGMETRYSKKPKKDAE